MDLTSDKEATVAQALLQAGEVVKAYRDAAQGVLDMLQNPEIVAALTKVGTEILAIVGKIRGDLYK